MITALTVAYSALFDLAKGVPTAAVLREHVDLLRTQIQSLAEQIESLEKEKAKLKRQIRRKNRQIANYATRDNFTEIRGVLFKKEPAGGYSRDPYCPSCYLVLHSASGTGRYSCSRCNFYSPFQLGELFHVLEILDSRGKPNGDVV